MGNQADSLSSTPKAKWDIPETWAANGKCPACGAQRLQVVHLPNFPDYLNCTICKLSFDVEDGGRHIHVKYLPEKYESTDPALCDHWVDISKFRTIIKEIPPPAPNQEFTSVHAHSFTDKEVWTRALNMYRMGNTPESIQLTLKQAGATQRQADALLSRLKKIATEETRKQSEKFLTVSGISLLLVLLLVGSWLFFSGRLSILLGLTTPTPVQQVNESSSLDRLLNLIPDDIKPSLLNLPDTVVDTRNGPGPSQCPVTAKEAASLFGGSQGLWTADPQFAAWQMVSMASSYTIHVPIGMVAGYIDNKTFQMTSIHGPATIYNANFVAIMCE